MNTEQVAALVAPLAEAADLFLYDVVQAGATLRISIDGAEGVPFDALERLSREISLVLDEHDQSDGSYMLEVSTPGVERHLRTAPHFAGAVGEIVTIKTTPGPDGRRRLRGELTAAESDNVTIDDDEHGTVSLDLVDIESARTIFEWGPAPKPGSAAPDRDSGSTQRPRSVS